MLSTPDIKGIGSDPTHHIVLNDGEYELGFNVTDQGGDLDERTFRRFPFAEPKDPYVTERQASFGGGFGQHKFEDDRAKYWKSEGVDTTKDKLVLGPSFHYALGAFQHADHFMEYSDDVFSWTTLAGVAGEAFLSSEWEADDTWGTTQYVFFWVRKTGTPNDLTVSHYSDTAGEPNAALSGTTIEAADVVGSHGQWVRFPLALGPPDGTYHVVWTTTYIDEDNKWEIGGNGTYVKSHKSADGSTWSQGNEDYFFRVQDNTNTAHHKFVEYKGQLYFVQSWDSAAADKLWMNGWRGAVTINVGDLDFIRDDTNTDWATKITGNEVVEIVSGPTAGELDVLRAADSDLTGLLDGWIPVGEPWRKAGRIYDEYIIYNSDWFQEIAQPVGISLKKVSDIVVSGGMMFFCRTNRLEVIAHREWNEEGTWSTDRVEEWQGTGINADFGQEIVDPKSGTFIWFGSNASQINVLRPEVCRTRVTDWADWTMNYRTIAGIYPAEWVSADSNVTLDTGGHPSILRVNVLINKVNTASISTPGATYDNGDFDIILVDPGSSGTASLNVTVSGGSITAINSYVERGYDYTTGAKTVTGLTGGDGNARITITGLDGFNGTGLLAYFDLVDRDENAVTVDVRYLTDFGVDVLYSNKQASTVQTLSAGELTFSIDDNVGSLSPFVSMGFPLLRPEYAYGGPGQRLSAPSSLPDTAGAEAGASIAFSLTGAKTKSFNFTVEFVIRGFTDTDIVTVGHRDGDNITGMNRYGDPESLWVFTESGMGEVSNNRFKGVPLREMAVAHHPNNGRANEVHDVYLMFSWRGRLQRYFRQNLEDLGPDFPSGLSDIAGEVVDVVTYPGRMYAAVDGGTSGRSLIMCFKGGNWHEVYTSFAGERIRELFIQAVPGKSDKLWASVGASVMWFPIALDSAELPANSDYKYRPNGFLDTSWIYTADMDLNKLWRSVVMVRNRAGDSDLETRVYFQIDDEDAAWTRISNVTDLSASAKEYNLSDGSAGAQVQGNRIRLRIELITAVTTKSPVVRSLQTRIYRLPEIRFSWTWIAKASSISINLRGDEEKTLGTQATVAAGLAKMDAWGAGMTQLVVETGIGAFNGRTVLMEPIPYQLLTIVNDEGIEEDVIQVSVNDI